MILDTIIGGTLLAAFYFAGYVCGFAFGRHSAPQPERDTLPSPEPSGCSLPMDECLRRNGLECPAKIGAAK